MTRQEEYQVCQNCKYFWSLGQSNYACEKTINGIFMLSKCLTNKFKYFIAPDNSPINLFTDLFQPPYPKVSHRKYVLDRTTDLNTLDWVITEELADELLTEFNDQLLDEVIRDSV